MVAIEVVLVAALALAAVMLFYKAWQQGRQQQDLETAFYSLLEQEDSCISLIQLAAKARVEPQLAKEYLEAQVKIFAATAEADADGYTFYRFPKLRSPERALKSQSLWN